jgi:Zn-dependent protease/predicted transcriptional regulator
MRSNVRIGRIFGIPIELHVSWFLIFGLLTWSLATGYFPNEYPNLSENSYWMIGVVTSVLFFSSVLLHELGHAYIAIRNQVPVTRINLFIFGGVAQIESEPKSASSEFQIAAAGPLVSLTLAGLFGGLWLLDRSMPILAAPSAYLFRINIILMLFNLIPGFPLDGGRIFRAAIWKITGSYFQSTKVASSVGQLIGYGFIGLGVFFMFTGQSMNGLWMAFIGWFLQGAAASGYQQAKIQQSLESVKVSQVMQQDFQRVSSLVPISHLVEEYFLPEGQDAVLIQDSEIQWGVITLREIATIPRRLWRYTTAGRAMIPFDRLKNINPDANLFYAIKKMDSAGLKQIAVVENGQFIGLLSRDRIMRYLRAKSALGM